MISIGLFKKAKHDRVWEILNKQCCNQDCLKSLSYNDVNEVIEKFGLLSSIIEERNYILNYLKDNTTRNELTNVFHLKGKLVCKQAWLVIHGINPNRLNRVWNDYVKCSELYTHGNKGSKKLTQKTSECLAWLNFQVNAIGDQQSDSGKVHLPSCFTKLST